MKDKPIVIDDFIKLILNYQTLNKQQIELLTSVCYIKNFKKGDYFSKASTVSNEIGFILEGVFRVYYYDQSGDEITRYFIDECNFIVDIESYRNGVYSTEYIQSLTRSTILIINRESMEILSNTLDNWDEIISKITIKALKEKVERISYMMPIDGSDRYILFLEMFPKVVNRVPLQYIASYIGVSKSSLSRIRRNVLNEANRNF